ncbi:kinase-like domain-containing protein [Tribonema minus]|uniref:Kinase-like domain-containing protein n=1 Tax=Tribonema minus TaxID=303371 RepID=A0A835ZBQ2_9STRA|nr:kinase-like domain-containing protein [Tribonema minus]
MWTHDTLPVFRTHAVLKAVETSAIGCWECNKDTGVLSWNPHMYTLFDKDWRSGPVDFEADFMARLHREDQPTVRRLLDDAVKAGRGYEACYRVVRKDEFVVRVRACADFVPNSDGTMSLVLVGTCLNVTGVMSLQEEVEEPELLQFDQAAVTDQEDAVRDSRSSSSSSTSTTTSSSSTVTRNQYVQPGKWKLGPCIGRGAFGQVHMGLDQMTGELIAEWVPGGSICSILQNFGPFTERITRCYAHQILQGIMYLHSCGIVHHDLKGDNVLVSTSGVVKIADFGTSEQAFDLQDRQTKLMGTPYFMAPEVLQRQRHNMAVDVLAFACVILQMLTGDAPWRSLLGTNKDLLRSSYFSDGDGDAELACSSGSDQCDVTDSSDAPQCVTDKTGRRDMVATSQRAVPRLDAPVPA